MLLKWRRDGQGLGVRRLETAEALANVPLYAKDLGVFDPDRRRGSPGMASCSIACT